jgi:hypothetical protein
VLEFIEDEIARKGGGNVTFYADELAVVGCNKTVRPALSELNALGLLRVVRYRKQHLIGLSDGWREIASQRDALIISARARSERLPPQMPPTQPATVSA